MKNSILFLTLLLLAGSLPAQINCSDIFISEYVEGWENNKALELYNPTTEPITLDGQYRLIRWSNGSATSDMDPLMTLPLTGTVLSFTTWVIIQDTTKPGQDTMVWPALRAKADWLAPYDYGGTTPGGSCVFWNGDDAVSLQKKQLNGTWKDIDIFGEIGVRPFNWQGTFSPSGAWTDTKPYWQGTGTYLTKQTLKRKHDIGHGVDRTTMNHYGDSTTGGFPDSFNALLEYDSLPVNFFDSLGHHWCDCSLSSGSEPNSGPAASMIIQLYPNPATDNLIIAFSHDSPFIDATFEVYASDGRRLATREITGRVSNVDLSSCPQGVYYVKIIQQGRIWVKRFIKQGQSTVR